MLVVLAGATFIIGSLLIVTWLISRLVPTDAEGMGPYRQVR